MKKVLLNCAPTFSAQTRQTKKRQKVVIHRGQWKTVKTFQLAGAKSNPKSPGNSKQVAIAPLNADSAVATPFSFFTFDVCRRTQTPTLKTQLKRFMYEIATKKLKRNFSHLI